MRDEPSVSAQEIVCGVRHTLGDRRFRHHTIWIAPADPMCRPLVSQHRELNPVQPVRFALLDRSSTAGVAAPPSASSGGVPRGSELEAARSCPDATWWRQTSPSISGAVNSRQPILACGAADSRQSSGASRSYYYAEFDCSRGVYVVPNAATSAPQPRSIIYNR